MQQHEPMTLPAIRARYPHALVGVRALSPIYEFVGPDAKMVSRMLNLALHYRGQNGKRICFTVVPVSAARRAVETLTLSGRQVVLADFASDPNYCLKQGIVPDRTIQVFGDEPDESVLSCVSSERIDTVVEALVSLGFPRRECLDIAMEAVSMASEEGEQIKWALSQLSNTKMG